MILLNVNYSADDNMYKQIVKPGSGLLQAAHAVLSAGGQGRAAEAIMRALQRGATSCGGRRGACCGRWRRRSSSTLGSAPRGAARRPSASANSSTAAVPRAATFAHRAQ